MKYKNYFLTLAALINVVYPLQLFIELLSEDGDFSGVYFVWFVIAIFVLIGIVYNIYNFKVTDKENKISLSLTCIIPLISFFIVGIVLIISNGFEFLYLMEILIGVFGIVVLLVYLSKDLMQARILMILFTVVNILYSFIEWLRSYNVADYGVDGSELFSNNNLLMWLITSIFLLCVAVSFKKKSIEE